MTIRATAVLVLLCAPFDQSKAYGVLTTDNTQRVQEWVGWELQE